MVQTDLWMSEHILRRLSQSADILMEMAGSHVEAIITASRAVSASMINNGKLLICGNGGSAADSQHLAAEFVSCLTQDFVRPGMPAIALTTDTSIITASANDFGFDGVFARQVEALGEENDAILGISTSGNSINVILAFEVAKKKKMTTIALCGEGGRLPQIADHRICVPHSDTAMIQQAHLAVEHLICHVVERILFGNQENTTGGVHN